MLAHPRLKCQPILLEAKHLVDDRQVKNYSQFLFDQALEQLRDHTSETEASLSKSLVWMRDQGEVLFLIDALDEASGDLDRLARVLNQNGPWKHCRFVISTRPYAIGLRKILFEQGTWQTLRVLPFDESQKKRFLEVEGETVSRYEHQNIKDNARLKAALDNPRVLQYLREVDLQRLDDGDLQTPADIMYFAMESAIWKSMEEHPEARPVNHDEKQPGETDLPLMMQVLGVCAFVLTGMRGESAAPNFDGIFDQQQVNEFRTTVFKRMESVLKKENSWIQRKDQLFKMLSQLDYAIQGNLLVPGPKARSSGGDRKQFAFSNRGIQEFFCGYYLANFCEPEDAALMWDQSWIVEWDVESTAAYNEIWQYFCDLPSAQTEVKSWLRTTELLYRPCFDRETGQFYYEPDIEPKLDQVQWESRRSPEFIYQTWWRLQELCDQQNKTALQIRDRWMGEFAAIAGGQQGKARQQIAQKLQEDFVDFPAGEVWFGSKDWDQPPSRDNIPQAKRKEWEVNFEHAKVPEEELRAWLLDRYPALKQQPASTQKRDLEEYFIPMIRNEDKAWERLAADYSRSDERTAVDTNPLPVSAFGMQCRAVTNAWFRLFSPAHGLRGDYDYQGVSGQSDCPALYIDWYTAWVYCQWCFWDEAPCRLPLEHEFEYAVKFGMPEADQLAWDYWWAAKWGDEKNTHEECHGNQAYETGTVPADSCRASEPTIKLDPQGKGVMDLLGNQQEWMGNVYQSVYAGQQMGTNSRVHANTLMSCRGGAWDDIPFYLRMSWRLRLTASLHFYNIGFRILRTK